MRTLANWFFSVKIKGVQSQLCLNLSWKNRKNTHKVAKYCSGEQNLIDLSLADDIYKATVHHLKMVMVKTLNCPQPQPHIHPLWLSKELSSQISRSPVKSIQVQAATFCVCTKQQLLLERMVNLKGYNDSPVENLGSCSVYLYHGKQTYKVSFEVTDSKGHMILGRQQALLMGYVSFSEIQQPVFKAKVETSIKTITDKPAKPLAEPVIPVVQECTDKKITIGGKTHPLPTTKEYLLKEYSDMFKGIGTLPGGSYYIKVKEDYKPVRHPPCQVAVSLKPAYKAELKRLVQLGVTKEVQDHTEWIDSIVLVKKPDGSLRLCLDPKDLNKAVKCNQWYNKTIDDVLPELANSEYFSLLNAKSGYWLTNFNTPWPWGKYYWVCLPFGLTLAGDVFQLRLGRDLKSVPSTTGITDDVLCHGNAEIPHDAVV